MADGWIKLSRQIQDSWVWKKEPFSYGQAWVDLLMLANYEDQKTPYKGEIITCKRGDVNLSLSKLATRWHWSRQRVSRFIKMLETDQMIRASVTTNRTVITIVNYDKFQCQGTTDVTTSVTTSITTSDQRVDTTKKEKKDKNIKKFISRTQTSLRNDYDFDEITRILEE